MKQLLYFFCLLACVLPGCTGPETNKMLAELTETIQKAPVYDSTKNKRIATLRQQLGNSNNEHSDAIFDVYNNLYEEYKVFNYDSAFLYAHKMKDVAVLMNDHPRGVRADIQLCFGLLSSGMFKETLDALNRIDISGVSDSIKAEYYSVMGRYYYDLGDYANDKIHTPVYDSSAGKYIDSALVLWKPGSYQFDYFKGLKDLKSGNSNDAIRLFQNLLAQQTLTPHQLAITASTLSDIYVQQGQTEKAINLLVRATIADIQSSTKETSAAFNLANLLYKKGDVKNAFVCINKAITDAVFYGARQRKVQVSTILPLIESEKLNLVESQKQQLVLYAVLVTVLLIAVVGLTVVIFRQIKKLKIAQKTISEAHLKEREINQRLSDFNQLLSDSNKIKEEYIGYFFGTNSAFFSRIEKFKKNLEQKIAYRKIDDIIAAVNNINLKKEKEELLKNFDTVFLKLFPNFVTEFNALFAEHDWIRLKENELLNTDLRIFALIRMGVHDTDKIAEILEYSVHTINTYKTKVKNKSTIPNEEFEKRIMKIRTV
ncbi:DUF6377 domain-containing protein [Danxiaibacter flavus]|uniref:DUF6377 domain-containing protein n=1 Tax=Danxiaibacter flavus TaxID=3049108 RepID=A0ABV3ZBT1_9BACT|nr:DUF6377 domain-containing protein [Chitinophagaceae bacterium DXS]